MATSTLHNDVVSEHRDAVDRLEGELAGDDAAPRRDDIKAAIIARYKAIDRDLSELAQLKDRLRALAQQWKTLAPAVAGVAPLAEAPLPTPGAAAMDAAPEGAVHSGSGEGAGAISKRMDNLNASTFVEKGWSLIAIGDHAGAEAALSRALELAPKSVDARSLMGWALMLQEKYDDALGHFQQVLMAEPANALARVNVGYICVKKGIFGEAIEHLSKAVRLDNDRKATLYANFYLGMLYFEREMYEDAQQFHRKAIALGPNLIQAYYELGRACWQGDDREGAVSAWRDGAAANKFSPWGKLCAENAQLAEGGGEPVLSA
ncbi:MAG: tetratricopeptide repeat protein [Gemmatimonadaceae bacterium]